MEARSIEKSQQVPAGWHWGAFSASFRERPDGRWLVRDRDGAGVMIEQRGTAGMPRDLDVRELNRLADVDAALTADRSAAAEARDAERAAYVPRVRSESPSRQRRRARRAAGAAS